MDCCAKTEDFYPKEDLVAAFGLHGAGFSNWLHADKPADEIKKLLELKNLGAIDETEFAKLKKGIIEKNEPKAQAQTQALPTQNFLGSVDLIFDNLDEVIAYFSPKLRKEKVEKALNSLASITKEDCPLLKDGITVPCLNNEPSLLLAEFPPDSPSSKRAATVSDILQKSSVLFSAVSGAGKTRLAFDVAKINFCLYFDMNGGSAKVRQPDSTGFLNRCSQIAAKFRKAEPEDPYVMKCFEHAIAALFVGRLISFILVRHWYPDLSPQQ